MPHEMLYLYDQLGNGPVILQRCTHSPLQMCVWEAQEEDVIGVLNSTDIAQLLPIGDRILVEVRHCSLVVMRAIHLHA